MKNIPTFKTKDGKYIQGRKYVEALCNAVYKDATEVTVDNETIKILSSVRNNDEWTVIIERDEYDGASA